MIYIINLDKRIERIQYLETKFLESGGKFKRLSAVDGASLSKEYLIEFEKYVNSKRAPILRNNEILRPNQIGCSLSHFNIYSNLIRSEDEFCVIPEDDIDFSNEFIEMIQDIKHDNIDHDASIIMFGYYKNNKKIEPSKKSIIFPKKNKLTSKINCFQPIDWYFGSHGYVINKKAAKIILDTFEYPTLPADYLLTYAPKLGIKLSVTEFPLVWINEFGLGTSDIQMSSDSISETTKQNIKFGPRSFLVFVFKKCAELYLSIYRFLRSNFTYSEVPFYVKKMPIHD